MPSVSRRSLLKTSATALGFLGLSHVTTRQLRAEDIEQRRFAAGYGALQRDPNGILDLPPGFQYRLISRAGERMDDGLAVPTNPDGMATFSIGGRTVLIRNHEANAGLPSAGPFALGAETFRDFDRQLLYDAGRGTNPALGGTTTLVYNTRTQQLDRQFLSLGGTIRNCAGGPTPWNTWVSCEETTQRATGTFEKDHGYCFEVSAFADSPVAPVPIKAMGRMNHEAIAVDPRSWAIYETEDRADSLFYRYLPSYRGNLLAAGGRLQALVIRDKPRLDTRNLQGTILPVGQAVDVSWVDIENPESPADDLRQQGLSKGAAVFSRGEGIWASPEAIYFTCTGGGQAGRGQVFRYAPSAFEGRKEEQKYPGRLELFIEPNDQSVLDMPDNITVAPWGDLILCEDGGADDYMVGVNLDGEIYKLAHNAASSSEFAGAVFSPDGTTLFVNIQGDGLTLAITGPWQAL